MTVTIEHLKKIAIFEPLSVEELQILQPRSQIQSYFRHEILFHEKDPLPAKLHILSNGELQVKKIAASGRETLLRMLSAGEIFAAPALFGNGIAPATIVAATDCEVLRVEKSALLRVFQQNPEVAVQISVVLTQRLNQLHETVHGLVSERAIVRLARLILTMGDSHGVESSPAGDRLKVALSHERIARTIGISYEECVRSIRSLQGTIDYKRGGQIAISNRKELENIAAGKF